MTPESYRTVRTEGHGEYEEKRSRFLACVRPTATEAEARALLEQMRAEHPTARHHVYAYLTDFSSVQRMSDDGEPQGTGGIQLMEPLQRMGYTNVCLVVTRYFGGTLLGAGPLARAYSKAARLALADGGEAEYRKQATFSLVVPYSEQRRIEYELSRFGARLCGCEYAEGVTLQFSVLLSERAQAETLCRELTGGKSVPSLVSEQYRPID